MVDWEYMIWVIVLGFIFLFGFFLYDLETNGVNDCKDDPKYCVTPQELHREWPQFNG